MSGISPLKLIIIVLLPALSFWPMVTSAGDTDGFDQKIEPVIISGDAIKPMIGAATENIRVYASQDDRLLPIPFQIDQKNSADDWVWTKIPGGGEKRIEAFMDEDDDVPQTRSLDLTVDDQDPPGKPTFDGNDVLVFMARDVGSRHTTNAREPGMVMIELEILDPRNSSKGWVYIARYASNPAALAKQRYVTYQENGRRVVTPNYELTYSPEHSVMVVDMKVEGLSILERSKINGKVKAGLGPLKTTMEFDERAIDGYDAGYINGPVRVVKRSINHVKIKAGMRSPDANCDHYYYPWHAEIPMLFSMRFPVKGVEMLAASRYKKDVFSRAEAPQTSESIRFSSSQSNSNLLAGRKDARWMGLYGDQLAIVSRIKVPKDIGDYFTIEPYLANDSGRALEAGYMIGTKPNIKKGEHILHSVLVIFTGSSKNHEASEATSFLDNQFDIKANRL